MKKEKKPGVNHRKNRFGETISARRVAETLPIPHTATSELKLFKKLTVR